MHLSSECFSGPKYTEIWNSPPFPILSNWMLYWTHGDWPSKEQKEVEEKRTKRVWVLYHQDSQFHSFINLLSLAYLLFIHPKSIENLLWTQFYVQLSIYKHEYLCLASNEENQFINRCCMRSLVHNNSDSLFIVCVCVIQVDVNSSTLVSIISGDKIPPAALTQTSSM